MNTRSRTTRTAVALVAATLALAPLAAAAEEAASPVTGTASIAVASRYVWRGQTLSEGFVVQPTIGVTYGGFTANLWSNVDLDNGEADDDGIVMNETDLTLSYEAAFGPVTATAGLAHYDFDGSDTQEAFITVSAATVLTPTLSLAYDLDEGDGAFATLSVSQDVPVGPVALTAGAALGMNLDNKAMGLNADDESFTGLYYGEVSLATSIPVFGKVSIDPRVAYAFGIGDGKDAIEAISAGGKKSMFYASVAATIAF